MYVSGMGNALQFENVATQLGFRSFGQLQTVVIRVQRSNTKADLFCTKVLYRQKFSDDFVQQYNTPDQVQYPL